MRRQCRGKEGGTLDEDSALASGYFQSREFLRRYRERANLLPLKNKTDDEQKIGDPRLDRPVAHAVLPDVARCKFDDGMNEEKKHRVEQRKAENHQNR